MKSMTCSATKQLQSVGALRFGGEAGLYAAVVAKVPGGFSPNGNQMTSAINDFTASTSIAGTYFKLRSFPTTQSTASRIAAIHRR